MSAALVVDQAYRRFVAMLDDAAIGREHTKPGDRALVWSQAPEMYSPSDRRVSTSKL